MKVEINGDSVAVETDPEDRELASALGDLVTGAANVARTIGVDTCEWCDERGRLRPYPVTLDGEFQVLDVCADCQADFVNRAADEAQGDADDVDMGEIDGDPRV